MILSFGLKNLLNFVMEDVFLNFTKPKVSGVNIPVVVSFFLFSGLEIAMRLKIHESYIFRFKHIDSGINGLLCSTLVLFGTETVLEFLVFSLLWQVIISIDGLAERFSDYVKQKDTF